MTKWVINPDELTSDIVVNMLQDTYHISFELVEEDVALCRALNGKAPSHIKDSVESRLDFMFSVLTVLRWFTTFDYQQEETNLENIQSEYWSLVYGY